jgi:starch-binding outer membrane protein, SusD/RagB family
MINKLDKGGRARFGAMLLTLWLGIGVVGCNSLLDVDNPNNVVGDDILISSAAQALANGALYEVQAGYTYVLVCYAQASDELHWVGSRDAFQQLDYGHVEYTLNEFTDQAYRDMAPARWMADKAIDVLEMHLAGDSLPDEQSLGEAYLWGALAYLTIADAFDDFTFSDMMVPQPPIGAANMGTMYTTAIGYVNSGLALSINADLERNLTAMSARLKHAQGVFNMIGQRPITTGPLAAGDAAAAAADAVAALVLDPSDWVYSLEYPSSGTYGDTQGSINSRLEMRFGNRYVIPEAADKRRDRTATDNGIALQDPIDAVGDPRLDAFMTAFEDDVQYADLPILSARELHLIIAEDALVRNDMVTFATNINQTRAWGGLTAWVDGGAGMPTALNMLIYERQVNLYLMMHRLNDMYRFGVTSDRWEASSTAMTAPGTFFPITKAEIDANCYINPDWPADVSCPPGG